MGNQERSPESPTDAEYEEATGLFQDDFRIRDLAKLLAQLRAANERAERAEKERDVCWGGAKLAFNSACEASAEWQARAEAAEAAGRGDGRVWGILYDDAAVPPEIFMGEAAEDAARATYKRRSDSWACHLVVSAPVEPVSPSIELRDAIDQMIHETVPPPLVVSETAIQQLRPLLEELLAYRQATQTKSR